MVAISNGNHLWDTVCSRLPSLMYVSLWLFGVYKICGERWRFLLADNCILLDFAILYTKQCVHNNIGEQTPVPYYYYDARYHTLSYCTVLGGYCRERRSCRSHCSSLWFCYCSILQTNSPSLTFTQIGELRLGRSLFINMVHWGLITIQTRSVVISHLSLLSPHTSYSLATYHTLLIWKCATQPVIFSRSISMVYPTHSLQPGHLSYIT